MKGKPWTANLAIAQVPMRDKAKRVTLVLPYYDNPEFLRKKLIAWRETYAADLLSALSLILVDDASPEFPALPVVQWGPKPFPIRVFRIEVDVRWNWLAARNIGFHHAPEGWVMVTDMDHVIPADTMRAVLYGDHNEQKIYGFSRQEADGTRIPAHPNSWLMTRAMFWRVGGYDETLSGYYGTDGDWRRRCAKVAPIEILPQRLIRHEYDGDSSTTRYQRKQPQDARVKQLIAKRGATWRPRVLSFPYREVTC